MLAQPSLKIRGTSDVQRAAPQAKNINNRDVPRQARDHSTRSFQEAHDKNLARPEAMSKPPGASNVNKRNAPRQARGHSTRRFWRIRITRPKAMSKPTAS